MESDVSRVFLSHGAVYHSRFGERENAFKYPFFALVMPTSDEAFTNETFKNRFRGLLSLKSKDFLKGEAGSIDNAIRDFLKRKCNYNADKIVLQTLPRMFGYVFNPISFWFCYRAGVLDAVLCEVNNTFGDRHFYWISDSAALQRKDWIRAEKVFHVSPFYPVEGYYRFRFDVTDKNSNVTIQYHSPGDELLLTTWVRGEYQDLANETLWTVVGRYGWMTPLVVLRIHWQALKLFRKRIPFFSRPQPPKEEIT